MTDSEVASLRAGQLLLDREGREWRVLHEPREEAGVAWVQHHPDCDPIGTADTRGLGSPGTGSSIGLCSLCIPAGKRRNELVDPITAALAAGAAAGLTNVATQAVDDAYGRLKAALSARFPQLAVHVQALEVRPESQSKQSSLAEELVEAEAEHDAELLQLAQALLVVLQQQAPEAAVRAGVDLEKVRAGGSMVIEDAQGGDVGVRGREWEVTGDIRISRAHGGSDPNS